MGSGNEDLTAKGTNIFLTTENTEEKMSRALQDALINLKRQKLESKRFRGFSYPLKR